MIMKNSYCVQVNMKQCIFWNLAEIFTEIISQYKLTRFTKCGLYNKGMPELSSLLFDIHFHFCNRQVSILACYWHSLMLTLACRARVVCFSTGQMTAPTYPLTRAQFKASEIGLASS